MRGPWRGDPRTNDEDEHERIFHPEPVEPAGQLEVEVADNPVVGRLLGPDGSVLVEVRERATVPFGFRASRHQ